MDHVNLDRAVDNNRRVQGEVVEAGSLPSSGGFTSPHFTGL